MLRLLAVLPLAQAPRALADGSSGTLGEGVVGRHELRSGGVSLDKLEPVAAARVIGRPAGATGDAAPETLTPAELRRMLATGLVSASFDSQVEAEAETVDAGIDVLFIWGYAAPDDGGGGAWRRVSAAPAHPGWLQTADGAVWELADDVVTPEVFGAIGDGVADDQPALSAAADYCGARRAMLRLRTGAKYGVGSPWSLTGAHSGLHVQGPNGYHTADLFWTPSFTKIVKLPGFAGAAAIIAGSPGSSVHALFLEGFGIDGAGEAGGGLLVQGGGTLQCERLAAFDHPTGWGYQVDGAFFPTFVDCSSHRNGRSSSSEGGGVLMSNQLGENADGRWIRGHVNDCGHAAIMFDGRSGFDVQTHWVFSDCEIGDASSYETNERLPHIVRLKGAFFGVFRNVKFMQAYGSQYPALACLVMGEAGAAEDFERLTFDTCTFQMQNDENAQRYAVEAAGPFRDVAFVNCMKTGTAGFLNLDGVTSGRFIELSPGIDAGDWHDPANRLISARGGRIGIEPGSGGAFNVECAVEGAPLKLGVRRPGSAGQSYVTVGDGADMERVSLGDQVLRLSPRATAPASPAVGDLAYSDGSGGGFDGAGGEGLYLYKGADGWVHLA